MNHRKTDLGIPSHPQFAEICQSSARHLFGSGPDRFAFASFRVRLIQSQRAFPIYCAAFQGRYSMMALSREGITWMRSSRKKPRFNDNMAVQMAVLVIVAIVLIAVAAKYIW